MEMFRIADDWAAGQDAGDVDAGPRPRSRTRRRPCTSSSTSPRPSTTRRTAARRRSTRRATSRPSSASRARSSGSSKTTKFRWFSVDAAGNLEAAMTGKPATVQIGEDRRAAPGATVPATLSLTLGPAAQFGAFTPGVARDYTATTTANVISTAGDAALTVADPSARHRQARQRRVLAAVDAAGDGHGRPFANVGGSQPDALLPTARRSPTTSRRSRSSRRSAPTTRCAPAPTARR